MMAFIKLTNFKGMDIYINMDKVVELIPISGGTTLLYGFELGGDYAFAEVTENVTRILKKCIEE